MFAMSTVFKYFNVEVTASYVNLVKSILLIQDLFGTVYSGSDDILMQGFGHA